MSFEEKQTPYKAPRAPRLTYYPRPEQFIKSPSINPPKTYAPLLVPPPLKAAQFPQIPGGARSQSSLPTSLSATHVVSSHIVTAAWPRAPAELFVESAHEPPAFETKEQRKARVDGEYSAFLARQQERAKPGVVAREEVLFSVFNRYRRKGLWDKNGLTLIVTHATGFPKEIWEPTYAKMIEQTEATAGGIKINEIWAYESPNHGDSAVINAGKLSEKSEWADSARDIIQFLLYYLPCDPANEVGLPSHLPRLSEHVAESRRRYGLSHERNIVGIGHSAGATSILMAALFEPSLFQSLSLLEPIIMMIEANDNPVYNSWVRGAIGRREKWASREEARSLYTSSPVFSYWDPEVQETFLKFGLMDDPQGPPGAVRLKTHVFQEAAMCNERRAGPGTYENMPDLNGKIDLRFILSGRTNVATGGDLATSHLVWRRGNNVSNVKIAATHLMVQESPSKTAKSIIDYLQERYFASHAKL